MVLDVEHIMNGSYSKFDTRKIYVNLDNVSNKNTSETNMFKILVLESFLMLFSKITKNAVKCLQCDEIIESRHVHDFVSCSCGCCSVDGGLSYLRRCGEPEDIQDISENINTLEQADKIKDIIVQLGDSEDAN